MNSREIEVESSCDEELIGVRQSIESGNWDSPRCARFKTVRDEPWIECWKYYLARYSDSCAT